MLSRVAEQFYWLGRHIERAENTGRMVEVNTHLLLDLPSGIAPGWRPLISIASAHDLFASLYDDYNERNVVTFLLSQQNNSGSLLSSLQHARENARVIRDALPREVWELVNELYLYANDCANQGVSQRGRYEYIKRIIRDTNSFVGLMYGTMSHDVGFSFNQLGRMLERSDMTTRILDVRSRDLLTDVVPGLIPFENIQWMSVMKSLSGYQMYRRKVQMRIRRVDALQFLLLDSEFPRALFRSLNIAQSALSALPKNRSPATRIAKLKQQLERTNIRLLALNQKKLTRFLDLFQAKLAAVHNEIQKQYFRPMR